MSKAITLLTILAALLLAAVRSEAFEPPFFAAAPEASPASQQPRFDPSMQAICKQVEVALDEGYGVSRHETRYVCQQTR
jgi:hypothetical protein